MVTGRSTRYDVPKKDRHEGPFLLRKTSGNRQRLLDRADHQDARGYRRAATVGRSLPRLENQPAIAKGHYGRILSTRSPECVNRDPSRRARNVGALPFGLPVLRLPGSVLGIAGGERNTGKTSLTTTERG